MKIIKLWTGLTIPLVVLPLKSLSRDLSPLNLHTFVSHAKFEQTTSENLRPVFLQLHGHQFSMLLAGGRCCGRGSGVDGVEGVGRGHRTKLDAAAGDRLNQMTCIDMS